MVGRFLLVSYFCPVALVSSLGIKPEQRETLDNKKFFNPLPKAYRSLLTSSLVIRELINH